MLYHTESIKHTLKIYTPLLTDVRIIYKQTHLREASLPLRMGNFELSAGWKFQPPKN